MLKFGIGCVGLMLISSAFGVEQGKPSKTSIWIATARAIGAKSPEPKFRNPDYLAIKVIGPRERAELADECPMDALDLDFDEAIKRIPAPVVAQLGRTKYIDATLVGALENAARQVVILGAGFDSRGFRFQERLKGVGFFEVDYGPTQEYKKRRVVEIFGSLPRHIRYVPVDFAKDDLLTELRNANYSPKEKTFFIWEGVTFYIPEAAVRGTLRFVRDHSGPGSTIIFNYLLASNPEVNSPKSRYAKWGEPFVFGFPADSAAAFVTEKLEVVSDVPARDPMRKYTERQDGTPATADSAPPGPGQTRFCIARVPGSELQQR